MYPMGHCLTGLTLKASLSKMMSTSSVIFSNNCPAIDSAYCSYREQFHIQLEYMHLYMLQPAAASACIYVRSDTIICTCLLKVFSVFNQLGMEYEGPIVIHHCDPGLLSYVCPTEYM